MPVGLEVWNAQGVKTLDTDDRIMRILGRQVVSGDGSLSHPGLSAGDPFYFLSAEGEGTYLSAETSVSVSGDVLTWSVRGYKSGSYPKAFLTYGVY